MHQKINLRRSGKALLTLALTTLAYPLVFALAARSAEVAADISEKSDLDAIVVTGAHIAEALHLDAAPLELPIAIQSVPIEVIQDEGFVRLGDAIRTVSGVVRKEAYFGLTDSFNVRGFDASTGLFNGFRHDYYGQVVDLAHVEAVEVIKGPASVTTGFLEPGGVVNVVTKRPTSEPITEFDVSSGSYDRLRGQVDISRKLNENLAIRVTGAFERTQSFRDDVESRRGTIGSALDWTPSATTKVALSAYYTDIRAVPDRGFPNDPVTFKLPIERFLGEPTDRYRLKQKEASAVVSQDLGDWLTVRSGFDWSRSDDLRMNTQLEQLQPDGRTYTRDYTVVPGSFDTKTGFAEGHLRFDTVGLSHKVVVGADWTQQVQRYNFLYSLDVPPLDIFNPVYGLTNRIPGESTGNFRGITRDVGVYLNDLIDLTQQLKLLVGVRHDKFYYHDFDQASLLANQFEQSATTPRVGLVYQFNPTLSIYANYARSFNPQQFTLLADDAIPAPTEGQQIEAGVKYQSSDGRLTASTALYQIRKTNVATPDPSDPTGLLSILSGADRVRGIEFDVSAQPLEGLKVIGAFSHMTAIVAEDEVLPVGDSLVNDPKNQASLWGRYDVAGTPVGIGGGVYYVGRREATLPNTFAVPGYVRIDAAFFWKANPHVDVAFNLQNLTNRIYYDSQDNSLFAGTPRSVLVSLRSHF